MGVIQIRKAQRSGARVVIGLGGVSGSGKTLTALLVAYGLTGGDGSKVGFLDAENRRGSLYADNELLELVKTQLGLPALPETFLIADLHPPFTPERYSEAIHEFQKAGVEVLVIDSTSHEWEGTGGCIEIADSLGKPGFPNWNKAKPRHKAFVNVMLQTDMHVIACIRAREKDKPEKVDGKTEYVKLGLQPIQEKNFMFEMTASVMMHEQGTRQDVLKCPVALAGILGRGEGYITAADGLAMRKWIDGAAPVDPKVEKYRNKLLSNCEPGEAHIRECWKLTPGEIQTALGVGFFEQLVESAKGYDELRAEQAEVQGNAGAPAPTGAEVKNAVGAAVAAAQKAEPAPAEKTAAQAPAAAAVAAAAKGKAAPAAAELKAAPAAAAAPAATTPAVASSKTSEDLF